MSLIAPRIERQIHARGAAGVEKFLDTRVAGVDALIEANLKPVASSRIGVDQAPGERHVRRPRRNAGLRGHVEPVDHGEGTGDRNFENGSIPIDG